MEEINIKELIKAMLKRWWVLFIGTVIFGGLAYAWSYYNYVPIYEASTTLFVGKNIEQNGMSAGDLYLGSALISDYREIAKSRLVASEVLNELGLKFMSPEGMAGRVGVTSKNDTRIIQITVSDTNPKLAMDITNKVAEVFQKKVIDIMQVENVQIIDKATLPRYPLASNQKRNIMLGLIFGFALGAGIVFLIEYLDNNIKTPEDVQKYLEAPVIAVIPVFQSKRRSI